MNKNIFRIKINFQTIEHVRFASISKPSLRFDTLAITAPLNSISRGAFAVSERVCTTEACAAPGGVYHRGLSCIWTCPGVVYTTGAWAASGHVYNAEACANPGCYTTGAGAATGLFTAEASAASRLGYTQGPELHLDLVGRQELVLLLDMSTLQGRELHLNVLILLVACTAAGLIYTTEAFIRICLHTGAWAASGRV